MEDKRFALTAAMLSVIALASGCAVGPDFLVPSAPPALFQALGGGWWNRGDPPAPEQTFDVATQEYHPVTPPPDPLSEFFRWVGLAAGPPPQEVVEARGEAEATPKGAKP